ncbi:MAG: hypothetical protein V2A73_16125, partial [Pseudomonadota bacterium]
LARWLDASATPDGRITESLNCAPSDIACCLLPVAGCLWPVLQRRERAQTLGQAHAAGWNRGLRIPAGFRARALLGSCTMDCMPPVVGYSVLSDQLIGREGGFLAIRRLSLANIRPDGSLSPPYLCDYIVRPKGRDAVVVALYSRRPDGGIDVLLRHGLRPPLYFGRPAGELALPDSRQYLLFAEVVAGILEPEDVGEEGIKRRAAIEAAEEAGYLIDPSQVRLLGAGTFPSPGAMAERFWLAAVEIADRGDAQPPAGDGSPMEEGSRLEWIDIDMAITSCIDGLIEDTKTEIILRRLRDRLCSTAAAR